MSASAEKRTKAQKRHHTRDVTKEAQKWAQEFIQEEIDTEGKYIAEASYEIQGANLREALVQAYMTAFQKYRG